VPLPPAQLLTADVFWNTKGFPDVDLLQEHLVVEGAVAKELLLDLIRKATDLFQAEPNLLKLSDPIAVVGDVHGQFYDLVKLLEVGGKPGDTQYIFLGDYVDRGSYSVEVLALLFALKIKYPRRVRMLRGNHECRQMTCFFNFREECEHKYDVAVYEAFMEAFDSLPLGATINGNFLAVHGGLSPDLKHLKAIVHIQRFTEPPREGLLCDLLWSDPLEFKDEGAPSSSGGAKSPHFIHNEVRGCSYFFSVEGTVKFLQRNQLLSIIRAHEAQLEGYKMHKTNPSTGFPSVITIFSAPNYCDVYNNKGAILKFDNSTLNVLQYDCSPHPYHLPNFMDVFTWSMPFVIEKVTEMLYQILQPEGKVIDDDELPPLPLALNSICRESLSTEGNRAVELACQLSRRSTEGLVEEASAHDRIRQKVKAVGRIARIFKTLRQERETVIRLKGVCPGHRLAPGLLLAGKDRMRSELEVFQHMQGVDSRNEKRPSDKLDSLVSSPTTPDRDLVEAEC